MKNKDSLAILILAAGTSSRLGRAKQLLELNSIPLLRHAVNKSLQLSSNVTVVLGYESDKCEESIRDLDINIIINKDYKNGIGSSISFGVSTLKDFNHILIMLCDQPLMPKEHFDILIKNIKLYPHLIIASKYNTKAGVPAIFPKQYYDYLLSLNSDKGAKDLLIQDNCKFVPLQKLHSKDVDTLADWEEVLKVSL